VPVLKFSLLTAGGNILGWEGNCSSWRLSGREYARGGDVLHSDGVAAAAAMDEAA